MFYLRNESQDLSPKLKMENRELSRVLKATITTWQAEEEGQYGNTVKKQIHS